MKYAIRINDIINGNIIFEGYFVVNSSNMLTGCYETINGFTDYTQNLIIPIDNLPSYSVDDHGFQTYMYGGSIFNNIYLPSWKQFNNSGILIKNMNNYKVNVSHIHIFSDSNSDPSIINESKVLIVFNDNETNTVVSTIIITPVYTIETTLQYQFVENFVFIVNNKYFTKIDWGDGSPEQIINDSTQHSYHKYMTNSICSVTFSSLKPIPYTWFTSPLITNSYGYIINCPNSVNINETVKLNYSFSEQATSSNRLQKIKEQTIYSNLKSRNPLLTTDLPKKYMNYESKQNLTNGNLYCKFNSVYAFQ